MREIAICTKCAIIGPAGIKCKSCGRNRVPLSARGVIHDVTGGAKGAVGNFTARPVWYLMIWVHPPHHRHVLQIVDTRATCWKLSPCFSHSLIHLFTYSLIHLFTYSLIHLIRLRLVSLTDTAARTPMAKLQSCIKTPPACRSIRRPPNSGCPQTRYAFTWLPISSPTPLTKIPDSQVTKLKKNCAHGPGRWYHLFKTALTIKWLAAVAVDAAQVAEGFVESVAKLEKRLGDSKERTSTPSFSPYKATPKAWKISPKMPLAARCKWSARFKAWLKAKVANWITCGLGRQHLGRDVATLGSDIAGLRAQVLALEGKHHGVVANLRAALELEGDGAGKAKAKAAVSQPTPAAVVKREETTTEAKPSAKAAAKSAEAVVEEVAPKSEAFDNKPVTTPAKFRVKREIEYGFPSGAHGISAARFTRPHHPFARNQGSKRRRNMRVSVQVRTGLRPGRSRDGLRAARRFSNGAIPAGGQRQRPPKLDKPRPDVA